jgi:CRP-like cAMP-binding protein
MSRSSPDPLAARLIATLPASRVSRLRLRRGATVFNQGDPASSIYVVEAGRIRLSRMSADGVPLILHVADRGETFAEASLSAARYHCDAIAETDSVLLAMPKADLLALMAADPAHAVALALALAAQVRDLRTRLQLRNVRSAKERVLAWLRLHAKGNPPALLPKRSWTLIAAELGLTREAVYRALAVLERERWIERHRGAVHLVASTSDHPGRRVIRTSAAASTARRENSSGTYSPRDQSGARSS